MAICRGKCGIPGIIKVFCKKEKKADKGKKKENQKARAVVVSEHPDFDRAGENAGKVVGVKRKGKTIKKEFAQ